MIWALKRDERIKASPKARAECPLCKKEVIAKCGSIKIWHWSHKSNKDCDKWSEGETKWHIEWKEQFPKEWQEVMVGKHFADIKNKEGLVIEFQNSPLSTREILKREEFYGNMVWVLNGKTLGKNIIFFKLRYKWKWFPSSWTYAKKKIYIDSGDENFIYQLDEASSTGFFKTISKSAWIIDKGGNPWKKKM